MQLTVNLRELYERLCPECKQKFLEVVRLGIPPEAILAALGIKSEEVAKGGSERKGKE